MPSSLLILVLILAIILVVPVVCRKLHIPSIVGFIIAGIAFGALGGEWLANNSTLALLGKLGILYIMFQVGIEIDTNDLSQHRFKAMLYGIYSFIFPFGIGLLAGWLLGWNWSSSLLLGAMLGSHTLITYPTVSRYGLQKTPVVNIVVGGTVLTLSLSLLVLAIVTNANDEDAAWWITGLKVIATLASILFIFPRLCRWAFKRWQDATTDFILTMVLLVCSALLAEWAHLDAIFGAFLCGVALNGLVPNRSPLMARINLIGNTLLVPMFLIGVGLLIDIRVFWEGWLTIVLAAVLIACKLVGKWLAAWITQLGFQMSKLERRLMFGLTHATAAGTLAIVTIGYNACVLEIEVLNAAVIMILVLCTTAAFVTENAAKALALQEEAKLESERTEDDWTFISINEKPLDVRPSLNRLAELSQLNNVELIECADWKEADVLIERSDKSTIIYNEKQPLNTIDRILVAVPRYAEKERDFISCFGQLRRLSGQIGAKVLFFATPETQQAIKALCRRPGKYLRASYRDIDTWNDIILMAKEVEHNDLVVFISSRRSTASYDPLFTQNEEMWRRFFSANSFMILYPEQAGVVDRTYQL